jgi:hypothetical protein
MVKLFISSLLGLASLQGVMAAPKVYPEVIPGPGLPSLAELNITSAQLYEMGMPEGKAEGFSRGRCTIADLTSLLADVHARAQELDKRFTPRCGPAEAAYTNVNDIIACYNYLKNLGTKSCVANENTVMCTAGKAHIYGSATNGRTSSYW